MIRPNEGNTFICYLLSSRPSKTTGKPSMKRLLLIIAVALASAMPMRAADSSDAVVSSLVTQAPGLRADVLKLALSAAATAENKGLVPRRDLLTVIDYSLPSSQPRLFIFDLAAHKLLFRELVAHGK